MFIVSVITTDKKFANMKVPSRRKPARDFVAMILLHKNNITYVRNADPVNITCTRDSLLNSYSVPWRKIVS